MALSPPQRFKRSLYKSAVRSVRGRKVEWIDQAENLLPGFPPSPVTLCLHLHYSGDHPHPKKPFEPLRRREWKWRVLSEKASNVFRSHYAEKSINHRSFFALEKLGQGDHMIIVTSSFHKSFVFKMFSVHTKTKPGVFKFLRFAECFGKASFSWRINVDGRPNRRIRAAFSRSSVHAVLMFTYPLFDCVYFLECSPSGQLPWYS